VLELRENNARRRAQAVEEAAELRAHMAAEHAHKQAGEDSARMAKRCGRTPGARRLSGVVIEPLASNCPVIRLTHRRESGVRRGRRDLLWRREQLLEDRKRAAAAEQAPVTETCSPPPPHAHAAPFRPTLGNHQ
jgi:hypothetical protein